MSHRRGWPPETAWLLAFAWGAAAYAVHAVGNAAGWYARFGWYQNLTHAWSASALALLAATAGLALGYRRRRRLAGFVLAAAAAGALLWEAVEFAGLLDPYGVPLHFHGFHDAAVDMGANAVGVGLALAALWWVSRNG